ncbi:phage head closure protein [Vibrio coralliilyticus]|uniref:phage head closure protein n=1 Tax=Vibrio coralliilyticus TaxID=190893 RepID=UPI0017CFAD87|nr:phage head closure protein [Vibrio coralliilyticus]NUW66955.1 phage head closure protein [Vibrio coralliilyticus]
MEVGRLNQRIVIEHRVKEKDAAGQPLDDWRVVCRTWANVRMLSGIQTVSHQADVSVVRASVRIRRRPGVVAGMRVKALGQRFLIQAVLPDSAQTWLDLVVEGVR